MPRINITEHSDTYSFQVRNNNYATVALPICAIWGPAYVANEEDGNPDWIHFAAGYKGTTDFMNTFKGPNTYLGQREKSYDYALKLLSAGYDILTKRVDGVGNNAYKTDIVKTAESPADQVILTVTAKYPGSYGKGLNVIIEPHAASMPTIVKVYDVNSGHEPILLELKNVALTPEYATDSIPLMTEAEFEYIKAPVFMSGENPPKIKDPSALIQHSGNITMRLSREGEDYIRTQLDGSTAIDAAAVLDIVTDRVGNGTYKSYIQNLTADSSQLIRLYNQQILYSRFIDCMSELTDPISYDWDVLFSAIADDQYISRNYIDYLGTSTALTYNATKLTKALLDTAIQSKCGCAFIGTPFNCPKTAAIEFKNKVAAQASGNKMLATFGEIVGPWCQTTLPISGANTWVAPELAHLLLIINAQGIGGINKWWMVPAGMTSTGVAHTPEYKIKKAYLDIIQNHDEGVCLNPLMEVPGKGFTCFGNSTLWDKPLGTYNALQNLSTRLLCNRVKQRIWDVALQILFKYNNENAYSHFYAGLSPLLDEMRSVGALTGNEYNPYGYKIIMNPDVINLDRINANTVIGKVYLAVTGVIDTVDVDLFLLPPTGFMDTYD